MPIRYGSLQHAHWLGLGECSKWQQDCASWQQPPASLLFGITGSQLKNMLQNCCLEVPDNTCHWPLEWQVASYAVQLPNHAGGTFTDLKLVLHLPSAS